MSSREAVAVFEDGCDARRGRWFDDASGVLGKHPHTCDDRCFLHQHGVAADREEVT